jgi:hypothetical protein
MDSGMKRCLVVSLALVLVLTAVAWAGSVQIGDFVLQDQANQGCWKSCLDATITKGPCEAGTFVINVRGLGFCQTAYMYVVVDGNQLIAWRQILRNGDFLIPVPSRYNDGKGTFHLGYQTVVLVLSTTRLFNVAGQYETLGSCNFLGYPPCGFVTIKSFSLYTRDCCQPCCFPCCNP